MKLVDLAVLCVNENVRSTDIVVNADNFLDGTLLENGEFAESVKHVLLSINKAISRLSTADKIPYKFDVKNTIDGYMVNLPTDCKAVKTCFELKNGKPIFVAWRSISKNTIALERPLPTINIQYSIKFKNFTELDFQSNDDLEEKYNISDEMCNYISYFAKSELFESSDMDRCKRYLNYFESFINELQKDHTYCYQDKI